jgi:hypothetical protein
MKRTRFTISEGIHLMGFFLFLAGSSRAHADSGTEIALWLTAMAVTLSFGATTLPYLGFEWLHPLGTTRPLGGWVGLLLRIGSWGGYAAAVYFRIKPDLPRFHTSLTLTTLLWAAWVVCWLTSRRNPRQACDTLESAPDEPKEETEKRGSDEKRL